MAGMASPSHRNICFTFAAGMSAGLVVALVTADLARPAKARIEATSAGRTAEVSARSPLIGSYRAHVLKVIDGDTIEARVHVWMGQELVTRVRLKNIDAPEIKGACGHERDMALASRDRLAALIAAPDIMLVDVRPDKYFGRVVARVLTMDGTDAGARLLSDGLARPYGGGRRDSWCDMPSR